MRTDILEREADIRTWVDEHKSIAYIAKCLNCKRETVFRYLKRFDIDYVGNQGGKWMAKKKRALPLKEYLEQSTDVQTNKVRQRLLAEGIKQHKCECCGLSEWLNSPIPLEVHHIDGNRSNNTIDNFQLLCPNCHAMTASYRGKNARVLE